MMNKIFTLFMLLLSLYLYAQPLMAGGNPGSLGPFQGGDEQFCRTYSNTHSITSTFRMTITRKPSLARTDDVVISFENFLDHLAIGNSRTLLTIEEENPILMDIGLIDDIGETPQIWTMPDFSNHDYEQVNYEHIAVESTSFSDSFPDPTHAVYNETVNTYELYELTQDDLFFFGSGGYDDNDEIWINDYYLAQAPIPLEWGLGYTGIVTFVFDEGEEYDSIVYIQYYDVIACGTLNTFDEGSVDALKLIFTEEEFIYANGEIIEEYSYHEIVWYSKEGHYIRAGIEDPWNNTGEVELAYMDYQKITNMSTATSEESVVELKCFPNPISSGKSLNIRSEISLTRAVIELFNVQGQKVNSLSLSDIGAIGQYEVEIPSELAEGVYFYRISDDGGTRFNQGKLLVL